MPGPPEVSATSPAGGTTMRRWMLAVGVFYTVLGIGLLPWVNDARIGVIGLEVGRW